MDQGVDRRGCERVRRLHGCHVQVWQRHEPEPRHGVLQFLLDELNEVFEFLGRTGPEGEAVARVAEGRVGLGPVELGEDWVEDPA